MDTKYIENGLWYTINAIQIDIDSHQLNGKNLLEIYENIFTIYERH